MRLHYIVLQIVYMFTFITIIVIVYCSNKTLFLQVNLTIFAYLERDQLLLSDIFSG